MAIESNVADFLEALDGVSEDLLGDGFDDIVKGALKDILAEIQGAWPSRTGRSRSAWVASIEGLSATLENTVDYSEYVHQGQAAAEAEATFQNGMEALARELEDAIEQRLDSI